MKPAIYLFSMIVCGPCAAAQADCPAYVKHDPGGDYTNADDRQGLDVVESFHFSKKVENLVQGLSGSIGGDISYTLEHFPNHHRALAAMAKLSLRDKKPQPNGARYPIDCFFDRAIRFKPDDATVRMVYGSYLLSAGQNDAALVQLNEAARLAPEHPTINYNLGLMYMKKKDYPKARDYAWKAYALGFPLPGLKNKLLEAGQWREAPARVLEEKEAAD
ncbi:tetratricopeptide repeat protein [Janthinobacterium agaricidamnosum]|uniref:Tetratricopeptide repeat family protein n=1 Tax=Janthinobacterium agaricidamnosum NBRC 102515 = DSM 9628 TaxID=1349767 RepID=W0V5Y9_9BURK|nr:tetratricopeptide repeat protein [Janthinobacterium agaricidamnosum]CDG83301.1 tetratricopeptide repeat family protein [Janthinobacterium agaricidamnosum NBRC 102515 = DSM 9628]